jgi:hypothetical protein
MHRLSSGTGPSIVVLIAATAALSACSFDSPTSSGQLTGSGVDTIPIVVGYTGTFGYESSGSQYGFVGSSEIAVGDFGSPGETDRGIVTFDVAALDGDTAQAATLTAYECDVVGNPFASLGQVVVDHITPGTPPAQSQYSGSTITSDIGVLAPDATTGPRNLTVTSAVESDVAANATYTQFRLRFSSEDGNPNGGSNYVDFETGNGIDCASDAALAPVLIVTY